VFTDHGKRGHFDTAEGAPAIPGFRDGTRTPTTLFRQRNRDVTDGRRPR
jgi:hypothetical protein